MYVTQWGERECERGREKEREKNVSRLGGRWCLLCFSLAFSPSTPSPHTHTHSRARRKVHKYASFNDESKTPASLTIAALKCETMICNSQTFWSPFKLDELSIFFHKHSFHFCLFIVFWRSKLLLLFGKTRNNWFEAILTKLQNQQFRHSELFWRPTETVDWKS